MSKKVFLFLTIFTAIIIGWPNLHFQSIFSQGDIGRDLYTFEQVFHGKSVYKDIWWVYGPLMPYYYGLFYLIFGLKITSILLGKLILNTLAGVFFFQASVLVMPAGWAFLAAISFLQFQQDFFFTYNHIGGITLMLFAFWMSLRYLYGNDLRFAYLAIFSCFLMGLVKINFGLSTLAAVVGSIFLINFVNKKELITQKNKIFYIASLAAIPAIWLIIYLFLFSGMPLYEIRQCMPYFGDDQPYHHGIFETIPYYVMQHALTFYHHGLNLLQILSVGFQQSGLFGNPIFLFKALLSFLSFITDPIVHICIIATLLLSLNKRFQEKRKMFWLTQALIWTFFVLNFHEFLVSGIWYRTYWSQPFQLFFNFFMIATAMSISPRWLKRTIAGIWIAFFLMLIFVSHASTQSSSVADKFLKTPRGQIYVGNESPWVDTVNTVTNYLNTNLKSDELFFAFPYDCLYYYLTGKPSPTRQLIFFEHIKISPKQELSIIQELERNKVNYILVSNRMMASETGIGIFGKTYCPVIYRYLFTNFAPVWRYGGNWQAEPGTNENHGVIIFKRK